MLKKIPVADLRLGMHLHALEGAWLDHPFWRSKFVLADVADLQAIHASPVAHCWIDPAKGLDAIDAASASPVAARPADPPVVAPAPVAPAPAPAVQPPVGRPPQSTVAFDDELAQAARLCRKSKQAITQLFGDLRMGKCVAGETLQPLVEELADSVMRNRGALVNLARLKARDDYSYMHSVAVCALMIALARELGLPPEACREAGLAGLLHDVGKALMPLEVLNKPGKLTEQEFAVMRAHPERGHAALVEGGTSSAGVLQVCLHHHERWDGAGYPHALAGEAIPELARMGAVCDVYDAVTSNRPYKAAWDPAESIACMAGWTGQFDPRIFAAFVRALGVYPSGSLVRLRSGRLAVVVEQHPTDLTTPVVKVFFSTRSNLPITVARVDLGRKDTNDAIVAREPRGSWKAVQIEGLWAGDALRR